MLDKNQTIDIVYYFQGLYSDELRYSIRSVLENISVGRIILVGDKPGWYKESKRSVYVKSTNLNVQKYGLGSIPILHLKVLLKSQEMPERFLLFNDDFFIMKEIKLWRDYFRDKDDYNKKALLNTSYHKRTLESYKYTKIKDPYNLHIPIMIEKKNFQELFFKWKNFNNQDIDFRTLYGNMFINARDSLEDCKIADSFVYDEKSLKKISNMKFISTSDNSFKKKQVGNIIRSRFGKPSILEML